MHFYDGDKTNKFGFYSNFKNIPFTVRVLDNQLEPKKNKLNVLFFVCLFYEKHDYIDLF